MKKILFILSIFICVNLYSQMDTEFWFVVPDVTANHGTDENFFRITTTYATEVTIRQPANPAFPVLTLSLLANSVSSVDLQPYMAPINRVENITPDAIQNCGFYITSTFPITIYYEKGGSNNAAIFNLKGKTALGTDFIIPLQSAWEFVDWGSYNNPKRGFDIVSAEDGTTVTITPSQNMVGHLAGIPFTINLDSGQTYSAIKSPISGNSTGFLEGTIVNADKNIAITIFDDSQIFLPALGGFDLTGDQIFPIPVTGKEYIAVKGRLSNRNDYVLITATQPNTTVNVNGAVYSSLTNVGDTCMICFTVISENIMYIQADKQVYAYHLTGNEKELTGSILPPIDRCTGSKIVGFTRSTLSGTNKFFFANIIVENSVGADSAFKFFINGVEKPGIINASAFSVVSSDWKAAQLDLTSLVSDNDACVITNDITFFHLGVFNAANEVAEYGYFSDLNQTEIEAFIAGVYDTNLAVLCTGIPKQLITVASSAKEYKWSPGKYLSDSTIANPFVTFTQSDSINYHVSVKMCSEWKTANVILKASLSAITPIPLDTMVCITDPIPPLRFSNVMTDANVLWYNDEEKTSLLYASNNNEYKSGDSTAGEYQYWVTQGMDSNCMSIPVAVKLTISEPLNQKAGTASPQSVCSDLLINLMDALSDADAGGYFIDRMNTGKLDSVFFNPSGLKGGLYEFAYSFPFKGCPVDTSIISITTDTEYPQIVCVDKITRTVSIGNIYTVSSNENNEFAPLSVSDNCKYKYFNDINMDSAMTHAKIEGSRNIQWIVTDNALNSTSCTTEFILLLEQTPNTITPNSDGHNDYFDMSFEENYPNAVLEIFDRWGKKIFISQPGYPNKWYGTNSDGSIVAVDTYHYVVRDGTSVMQIGFISVIY